MVLKRNIATYLDRSRKNVLIHESLWTCDQINNGCSKEAAIEYIKTKLNWTQEFETW